jgi:hypothetical protein
MRYKEAGKNPLVHVAARKYCQVPLPERYVHCGYVDGLLEESVSAVLASLDAINGDIS